MSTTRPTVPQIPQLRTQAALSTANAPIDCPKCGSIYFLEVPVTMLTTGSGGFRPVGMTPNKIHICPCGEVQVPKNFGVGVPAGSERDLFVQSVRLALDHKNKVSRDLVAQGTPSLSEFNKLKTAFDDLAERFNQMLLGEQVDPIEIDESETLVGEGTEQPQEQEETLTELASTAPIATGVRGRSAVSATKSTGDVKQISGTPKPVYEGGARGQLKRQGA